MDQPVEAKTAAAPIPELAPVEVFRNTHLRWYHVEEPESPILDRLAQEFGFHELEIEDCRHLRHTAKLEEYENHIFLIANTLHFVPETLGVWFGELDIFLGQDFVVTVHAGPTRSVREVLPRVQTIAKLQRPDRVVYALLDSMVDRYLPVLDEIGDRICQIEDEVHASASVRTLEDIFALRRGLTEFRRVLSTMREAVNAMMRFRPPYYRADMAAYWRDLYDHIIRATAEIEAQRELLASVLEVYLTATANRTNEIMKVLTIYATIVLPMVVITGYFGMNFEHLPFLEWRYGVQIVNGLMVALTIGLLIYFRKRGWL
ncbi:MAG TPA: magnesium/cobalt transporter CorA [Candidatus Acidoferrales bacterium]|nr:magnesium/cobalt transporter CorA [Candidatus Acidoferrales bacterium]